VSTLSYVLDWAPQLLRKSGKSLNKSLFKDWS
jgi:hypothetical protein